MLEIKPYENQYKNEIIDLILTIQQKEFNVPITIVDQPDLQIIPEFYQQKNGNFWVAISENKLVGTIALIDIGENIRALRKMFVHQDFRGKDFGISILLLNKLLLHCLNHKMQSIYLGTNEVLKAAMRFYEKNGFVEILKKDLPQNFPIMQVDNHFYEYDFQKN